MNGFKAVGFVALKDAGRVDDRVDALKALPPVFEAIAGKIAMGCLPAREHEAKLRCVPSTGDDLMPGPGGLDGNVPPDESARRRPESAWELRCIRSSCPPRV